VRGALGVLLAAPLLPLGALALDRYGRRPTPDGAYGAIVVAGCKVMPDGRPSPALERRVRLAVSLRHLAPRLVLTGGRVGGPISEAEAGAALAVSLGVPEAAIVLEDRSRNTCENARFTAALLPADTPLLVVSCGYHRWRCERYFRQHFTHVDSAGAASERPWRHAAREAASVVNALANGWL
jgi:uncharacterized SAM-binding protein YcdF (DUF218 family)